MAGVDVQTIHPIGHLAAQNIAAQLGLSSQVDCIEKAIADEIQLMSSHFTMSFAEIETNYAAETLKLKNSIAGRIVEISASKRKIAAVAAALFLVGAVVGHFV